MKQALRIVLILALVLLPFTPMDAYAEDENPIMVGLVAVAIVGWIVFGIIMPHQPEHYQFSANGDEQETLLTEQLERLKPIDNVGSQTNFTPTENANVHGAMYPVFEW